MKDAKAARDYFNQSQGRLCYANSKLDDPKISEAERGEWLGQRDGI